MKKRYSGKTKDVFETENGSILLLFKDDMTGNNGFFDPGANQVGLTIDGAGYYGLAMSQLFFNLCEQQGIPTHYLGCDLTTRMMKVKSVEFLGQGLEVIYRQIATGSFIRRYGAYCQEGQRLDNYIEFSLKDDERNDPFISESLLNYFGILKAGEYNTIKQLTLNIVKLIQTELNKNALTLCDLKVEFGRDQQGNLVLIDELSAGNMRVYQRGEILEPLTLSKIVLGDRSVSQ